jgi:site-specific DNA recombinase
MADRGGQSSKAIRCAIYTRKSSEEGLEQDFNSLHAQREACEAYIASQRHEGWRLVPAAYDDGGYSGGSMERPGLKTLLSDIQAGLIDVVVVYKVDRLTRSLMDFARIVESFDLRGVSFVSVTQSFNTTTSMGRLTLNVLLSFAQFEREVTGERIRDKIAASKRKGLWMGGIPPIGYRAEGRSLEIEPQEAVLVRHIFNRYVELRNVAEVKVELDRARQKTRSYQSASNRQWGGKPFSVGHLRSILSNPVYLGEIVHKGERFKGQHQPIIERGQFAEVQQLLALTRRQHRLRLGADHANLLAGLIEDEYGRRFSSSHTSKKGQRYRYYVRDEHGKHVDRIPAGDLEVLVIARLTRALTEPGWINALAGSSATPDEVAFWLAAGEDLSARLGSLDDEVQREAIASCIKRVQVFADTIEIKLKSTALGDGGSVVSSPLQEEADLELSTANTLAARPRDHHLMIKANDDRAPKPTKWLLKAVARGVTWYDDLKSGKAASLGAIAEQEDVTERYVAQLIRLAFLKPDIVKSILEGTATPRITGADVASGRAIPLDWSEQVSVL